MIKLSCGVLCCIAATVAGAEPLVIAHRGASGYLPEHTLEAYAMAHALGAGYIEPDLVMTKDAELICLHDIELEATTDVEEKFPDRKRDDGHWYAADFTLAEIKQLSAHERMPKRFPLGKAEFTVPTFGEMIELVQGLNQTTGREAGIYPELKSTSFHQQAGLPLLEKFLEVCGRYGYEGPEAKIYVQCFEPQALRDLRSMGCALPMIVLLGGGTNTQTVLETEDIASFAQGVGPDKNLVLKDPEFVSRAHDAGLKVHIYTLRADMRAPRFKSYKEEVAVFTQELKVDGYFTDFPGLEKE